MSNVMLAEGREKSDNDAAWVREYLRMILKQGVAIEFPAPMTQQIRTYVSNFSAVTGVRLRTKLVGRSLFVFEDGVSVSDLGIEVDLPPVAGSCSIDGGEPLHRLDHESVRAYCYRMFEAIPLRREAHFFDVDHTTVRSYAHSFNVERGCKLVTRVAGRTISVFRRS